MSEPSHTRSRVGIVIIGAGPAAVMLLERLLAQHRRDTPELALDVCLVDPHPPGGGRIWRREQSPLLKLNSTFADVAFFTDVSCQLEGPVAPGPTLYEWVELVRTGDIDVPEWADELLLRELATAAPTDFPTRRLNSAYLGWAFRETARRAAPTVAVAWQRDLVTAVNAEGRAAGDPHTVHLVSGAVLRADIVVHAVGHNGSLPSNEAIRLGAFAERRGLAYVAPAFTADLDLDWVGEGDDVIVRGMGLAAVDLTVLLTEGRGGRFERLADGGLRYLPSGREPVLHLGSRRGVPYRSKIASAVAGEPVALEYLGSDFHQWIAGLDRPLDFVRDAWPRIAAEMLTGYYRELFTGHPGRVLGTWEEFSVRLREILAGGLGHESDELLEMIRQQVPNVDDRFDLASFDRPLAFAPEGETGYASSRDSVRAWEGSHAADAMQRRVRAHIAQDLRQRTLQQHSATQALFLTLLFSYMSLAEIPAEKWNAISRTHSLPKHWHSYFSYLASGPPGHRLEELLALSDAGVVRFLGGELELTLDEERGLFVASGSARVSGGTGLRVSEASGFEGEKPVLGVPGANCSANGSAGAAVGNARSRPANGSAGVADGIARSRVAARTLIDAWLPEAQAAASDNPLLRQLVSSGQAREVSASDASHTGTTGQLEVDVDGALLGAERQFTVGPFTSATGAGAFTRPGLNSLPFRIHDRRARAILDAARAVGPATSFVTASSLGSAVPASVLAHPPATTLPEWALPGASRLAVSAC